MENKNQFSSKNQVKFKLKKFEKPADNHNLRSKQSFLQKLNKITEQLGNSKMDHLFD